MTWRDVVVGITVADKSDGFDPPTEDVLTNAAILAWTRLGLVLWFLLGAGTLRHLFGITGLRATGGSCSATGQSSWFHYTLTYELSTSDYGGAWCSGFSA